MKKSIQLVFAATMSFAAFLLPAAGATSPPMTYCSGQWAELKEAGKTRGQTWPQFWSRCSKAYAEEGALPKDATKAAPRRRTARVAPAMTYCSGQWAELKEAGKTRGQTWPQFWSQCSKDYAAEGGRSRTARSADAEVRPCRPSLSNLWTCPETPSSSARKRDTTGSSAQKQECDERWRDYKVKTGARGWQDYFAFMSKCMS